MKIKFKHSIDYEVSRIRQVITEQDYFKYYRYKVFLPNNMNIDSIKLLSDDQILILVENEYSEADFDICKTVIIDKWNKTREKVEEALRKLTQLISNELVVQLTKYGAGGSYLPPNRVILNVQSRMDLYENMIHEYIHDLIEITVVERYKLSQKEKESLVDDFMIKYLSDVFPKHELQGFGSPSEELLAKIGWK